MSLALMERPVQKSATLPTMPARQLLRYVRAAQRLGARLPVLMDALGIAEADLRNPELKVAGEVFDRLIRVVNTEIADPLSCLRLGEESVPHTFSDLNFGALFLSTLGAALSSSVSVQIDMNQRFKIGIDRGQRETAFALLESAHDGEPPVDMTLIALGLYSANIRATGLDNARFTEVHLPGPRLKQADAIAKHLGCPVYFGADRNKTVIANALLERPPAPRLIGRSCGCTMT